MVDEDKTAVANGIQLGESMVLTVMHVIVHAGWKLKALDVEGVRARVLRTDGDLALLKLDAPLPIQAALKPHPFDEELPDGTHLTHVYYDHVANRYAKRHVVWNNAGYLNEPCPQGMSGSGCYDSQGRLVCMIEWTNGFVWGPLDIVTFLEA